MSLNAFTNNSHHKTGYMQLVSSLNARSWLKFLNSIRLSTFLCHHYHYHHSPTSQSSFDQSPNDASGLINQSINRRRNIFEKKSIHYIYQYNSQRNKIIISWCCRPFAVFIYSNYRPVLQIPEFTGILWTEICIFTEELMGKFKKLAWVWLTLSIYSQVDTLSSNQHHR